MTENPRDISDGVTLILILECFSFMQYGGAKCTWRGHRAIANIICVLSCLCWCRYPAFCVSYAARCQTFSTSEKLHSSATFSANHFTTFVRKHITSRTYSFLLNYYHFDFLIHPFYYISRYKYVSKYHFLRKSKYQNDCTYQNDCLKKVKTTSNLRQSEY